MQQTENNRRVGFIGALHARLVALATFSRYAVHRFSRDGCFAASGALSYTTLVSLVPLGVIALAATAAPASPSRQRTAQLGMMQ